jgi:hypothetical protein
MNAEVTQPIATRKLSFGSEELTVILGKPEAIEDNDFLCPYMILAGKETKTGYAIGIDGIQAIQLAMKKISIDLICISKASGIPIFWNMGGPGDIGFNP